MARPTIYSDALVDKICAAMVEGNSINKICKDETFPAKTTVFRWLGENKEFRDKYDLAAEERSETLVEEMLDISDDNGLEPADKRVRVDTRKWIASKLKPKKYGDKQEIGGEIVVRTTPLTAGDADLIARYSQKNNGEDK